MEAIQRETLVSLSNSVKLLLEEICSIELLDNFRNMNSIALLLKKVKETLVDLQDVLYRSNEKPIPTQANSKSLNLLRRAVFQVANLLPDIVRYAIVLPDKQLKISFRLRFLITIIESKREYLIQILKGSRLGEQLDDDESYICGRDSDIQKLKDLLLSNSSDDDCKIRIISIVGMGGIGKTTLAKHLYADPQVNYKFELKVWADFSQDVNDWSVFDNILESITSQKNTNNASTFYPKFLLVLDGVWDARSVNWTLLMDILNAGETGVSRIIVTSRDERVALSMKTFLSVHYLRPLKVEDCWSLLVKHTYRKNKYKQSKFFEIAASGEEFCWKIAKECDGLPLGAVAYGALLHFLLFSGDWHYVLASNVLDMACEVHASLDLSYNFLSDPLKQCFQYCSIFPKKSILEKKMVV